jgi:hypothetical protein
MTAMVAPLKVERTKGPTLQSNWTGQFLPARLLTLLAALPNISVNWTR